MLAMTATESPAEAARASLEAANLAAGHTASKPPPADCLPSPDPPSASGEPDAKEEVMDLLKKEKKEKKGKESSIV